MAEMFETPASPPASSLDRARALLAPPLPRPAPLAPLVGAALAAALAGIGLALTVILL